MMLISLFMLASFHLLAQDGTCGLFIKKSNEGKENLYFERMCDFIFEACKVKYEHQTKNLVVSLSPSEYLNLIMYDLMSSRLSVF